MCMNKVYSVGVWQLYVQAALSDGVARNKECFPSLTSDIFYRKKENALNSQL